jgi:hypothetical protein
MASTKEGMLWKQGKDRHNWKRRHFTVTQEDKRWVLQYFTDDTQPQKKGELFFDSTCTVMSGEGKEERLESKRQSKRWSKTGKSGSTEYRFVINFPSRQLLLSAQSKAEMDDWIRYFQEIISSHKPEGGGATLGVTSPLHETTEEAEGSTMSRIADVARGTAKTIDNELHISQKMAAGKEMVAGAVARVRGASKGELIDVHVDEHRTKLNSQGKEFVEYKVRVTQNNRAFSFWSRYSEMNMMHSQIDKDKALDGIVFPGKGFLGMIDVDQRKDDLDLYFQALSAKVAVMGENRQHSVREYLRLDMENPEMDKGNAESSNMSYLDMKPVPAAENKDDKDMPAARARAPSAVEVLAEMERKFTTAMDGELDSLLKSNQDEDVEEGRAESAETFAHSAISLILLGLLPICLFLILMSDLKFGDFRLGHGVAVYKWLHSMEHIATNILGLVFVEFFVLYVLDVSYWDGRWASVRKFFFVPIGAFGLIFGALAMTNRYAAAPLGIFFVMLAVYTDVVSRLLHPQQSRAKFFLQLSSNLGITAMLMIVVWVIHTFFMVKIESVVEGEKAQVAKDNLWSNKLKHDYIERLDCKDDDGTATTCLAAYLIWSAPLAATFGCILIGIFARLLGKSLSRDKSFGMVRLVIGVTAGMGFLCWSAASIGAGGTGIADVIFSLVALTTIVLLLMLTAGLGWESLKHSVQSVPLMQKLGGIAGSDWVKSLFVLTCWMPFLFYLALSALNQCVRVHLGWHPATALHAQSRNLGQVKNPVTDTKGSVNGAGDTKGSVNGAGADSGRKSVLAKAVAVESHHKYGCLTKVAANQVHILQGWRWSSVLCKSMWWGVAVMCLVVGITKVVTVFLSWLNFVLSSLPSGVVVGLFYAIGLSMFLNPAIPGVPVYLSGGVIVVSKLLDEKKLELVKGCFEDPPGSGRRAEVCKRRVSHHLFYSNSSFVLGATILHSSLWASF